MFQFLFYLQKMKKLIKYYEDKETISEDVLNQIFTALKELENISGKKFGDVENPLLVSVRSGEEHLCLE